MHLAKNGIFPPNEWHHDPNIRDKSGHTVADYLKENHLPVPNEWYDDSMKDTPKHLDFV